MTARPILFVPNYYWIFLPCSCLHEQWDLNTIFLSVLPSADALSCLHFPLHQNQMTEYSLQKEIYELCDCCICFAPVGLCVSIKWVMRYLLTCDPFFSLEYTEAEELRVFVLR